MIMKALLLLNFALSACFVESFAPLRVGTLANTKRNASSLSMSALSDAQALLAKARALREQADSDEHELHSTLIEKKKCQNSETDAVIEKLFPLNEADDSGPAAVQARANRIEDLKLSTDMLKKVVERLHEREISARGLEHIESSQNEKQVKFVKVESANEEELERVQGLILKLIAAADKIDEKYLKDEQKHHNADTSHWSRGSLGKVLTEKHHFLSREHDDSFKKRTKEYYEAAKKKEDYDSYSGEF